MKGAVPELSPFSSLRRQQKDQCKRNWKEDNHTRELKYGQFICKDHYYAFKSQTKESYYAAKHRVEAGREEKIDSHTIVKNEAHGDDLNLESHTFEVPKAEQMNPVASSSKIAGTWRNKGTILMWRACSKFQRWNTTINCLKRKNTHRNRRGNTAVLSFLTTTNFISAPATKIPIKLFTGHASGNIIKSRAPTKIVMKRDVPTIAVVLLRQTELMSTKYTILQPRATAMVNQKAT